MTAVFFLLGFRDRMLLVNLHSKLATLVHLPQHCKIWMCSQHFGIEEFYYWGLYLALCFARQPIPTAGPWQPTSDRLCPLSVAVALFCPLFNMLVHTEVWISQASSQSPHSLILFYFFSFLVTSLTIFNPDAQTKPNYSLPAKYNTYYPVSTLSLEYLA